MLLPPSESGLEQRTISMSSSLAQLRARRIAGILLVAIGVSVCAADAAEASCGHYVKLGGRSVPSTGSSPIGEDSADRDNPLVDGERPAPAPLHCEGPTCSKDPISPAGPPSNSLRVSADKWASFAQTATEAAPVFAVYSRDSSARASSAPTSRIFRPPRISAF